MNELRALIISDSQLSLELEQELTDFILTFYTSHDIYARVAVGTEDEIKMYREGFLHGTQHISEEK